MSKETLLKVIDALEATIQEIHESWGSEETTQETLEFAQSLLDDIQIWENGEED
tara:strand:- start:506 stop:667 length:162 start_codon:yes stop_codon:yes gene_type:complete